LRKLGAFAVTKSSTFHEISDLRAVLNFGERRSPSSLSLKPLTKEFVSDNESVVLNEGVVVERSRPADAESDERQRGLVVAFLASPSTTSFQFILMLFPLPARLAILVVDNL
jgi:hypothetical protein